MSDTQWARYQVFVQEKPGDAYQDAGSVHAPDAELALLNARDVFARRPGVSSLWVVPAEAIFSRTRQEWEEQGIREKGIGGEDKGKRETYYTFCKPKPAGTQTLLGIVEASSPEEALQQTVAISSGRFPPSQPPFAWWVFPARLLFQNDPQDVESMFAPALDKPFRLSTDYHVVTEMREIKSHVEG